MPMLVRYPRRIRAGWTSDVLVSNVDLAPTLLSLAGLQSPPETQGWNLSGVLTERNRESREALFDQHHFSPVANKNTNVRKA